jgi:hypothetical protein
MDKRHQVAALAATASVQAEELRAKELSSGAGQHNSANQGQNTRTR